VAVTPDGAGLYVADMNSDSGTSTLDAAITDIAFAPAP
jgi:hypothetical protein